VTARREVAIGLGAYACYLAVRHAVWSDDGRRRALRNAERIVALERRLGLHVEPAVQARALVFPRLVHVLNVGYAAGNVALSVGWLLRLYRMHDPSFRHERRAAVISFAAALPVFAAFPTAPPRGLDGFVDTFAFRGITLDHPLLVRFYNPIAAMPSHHVAFAMVTGNALAHRARSRTARSLCRAYPAAVATVVVATANHFIADVVAGAALGVLARRVAAR
jgi:hypothetical protein